VSHTCSSTSALIIDVGEQSVSVNDEACVVIQVNQTVGRPVSDFHVLHSEISKHFKTSGICFKEITSAGSRRIGDQEIAIHNDLRIFHIGI